MIHALQIVCIEAIIPPLSTRMKNYWANEYGLMVDTWVTFSVRNKGRVRKELPDSVGCPTYVQWIGKTFHPT